MAGLVRAELPETVAEVVEQVAALIGVTVADLFVADHNHEGLSEGAYSIAYEGDPDWPHRYCEAGHEGQVAVPAGLFCEPGTSWYLAVYPDHD